MYKRHRARVEGGTTAAEQLANAAAEFIFGIVFLTYPFVEPPSGSVIATPPCISISVLTLYTRVEIMGGV